jgi:hypothetical protein
MNLVALLTVLNAQLQAYFGLVRGRIATLVTRLNAHVFDMENPHKVDKNQLGLDMVQNWEPSTKQQAIDGVNNSSYMTPKRTAEQTAEGLTIPLAELIEQATADLNR